MIRAALGGCGRNYVSHKLVVHRDDTASSAAWLVTQVAYYLHLGPRSIELTCRQPMIKSQEISLYLKKDNKNVLHCSLAANSTRC